MFINSSTFRVMKPFVAGFCTCAFLVYVFMALSKSTDDSVFNSAKRTWDCDPFRFIKDENASLNPPLKVAETVSDRIRKVLIHGNGSYNLNPENRNKDSISQYGQDKYLSTHFGSKKNGFFVEIGAHDGQSLSNTLRFEMKTNWTGLLIEANPHMFYRLASVNRNCYAINCCLGYTNTNLTFTIAGFLTSADELITSRHRNRINNEMNNPKEKVTVQCYSLLDILNVIGTRKVDYFSLDVEGAELYILESIDWGKIDIDVFTIETDQHRDEILSFMKDHRYKWLATLQGDDIFGKQRN